MNAVVEPNRHKLTVDDFVRMGEAGIFAEDARIELIEGDLFDMPPIGTRHSSVSNRLNRLLVRLAGDATLRFDRITKARVYAANGIGEYWIVDLPGRRLHAHRGPTPGGNWASVETLEAPFRLSPAALPALVLSSDDLWPAGP